MKSLSELVTEYRQIIDQPFTAIWSPTMANREINKAATELYTLMLERNHRFFLKTGTIATVAATPFVDYPSDCVFPNKLLDSGNYELKHMDMETFEYSAASGTPTGWFSNGRKFIFSPVPDSIISYTLYYSYMPSEMAVGTSTPTFIPGYEGIIALKAALNSHMIKDEDVRDKFQYEYAGQLKALLGAVGTSQTGASGRVINSSYDMGEV
jgi:hypothetical protein